MASQLTRSFALALVVSITAAVKSPTLHATLSGVAGKIALAGENGGIYVVSAAGGGLTRLTTFHGEYPAWSPDGKRIAYASEISGARRLYVVNADGTGSTQVTFGPRPGFDQDPAWSADGLQIAFSREDASYHLQVWVMNADGTNQRNLSNTISDDFDPSWSPDGLRIVFTSGRLGRLQLFVMNADGTHQQQLTNDPGIARLPDWSPDGTKIAFERSTNLIDADIWIVTFPGGVETQLTTDPATDTYPSWSPDGTQIAFSSNRNPAGYWDIFTMDSDGRNQKDITNTPGLDVEPAWGASEFLLPPPAPLGSGGQVFGWGLDSGALDLGIGYNLEPRPAIHVHQAVAMTSSGDATFFVQPDGTLWGVGASDELGIGLSGQTVGRPAQVHVVHDVVSVSASQASPIVAAERDGSVWMWGDGLLEPGEVIGLRSTDSLHRDQVVTVSAGGSYALALLRDGTVRAWGVNNYGQLGYGGPLHVSSGWPVQVFGLDHVRQIAAGKDTALALKTDGTVWAWGRGDYGQLGATTFACQWDYYTVYLCSTIPVQVNGLADIVAVAAGEFHNLAVKRDGTLWAWGSNGAGVLGNGTFSVPPGSPCPVVYPCTSTPTQVLTVHDVVAIAAAHEASYAVQRDGSAWAWGGNVDGPGAPLLGDGDNVHITKPYPVRVSNVANVTAIAAGYFHALVIGSDTGNNIVTRPMLATGVTNVTVTFATVTRPGTTSMTSADTGPLPPAGYTFGNPATYYDITTTTVFSGGIEVCIEYGATAFPAGQPALFHYEAGVWVDRTSSVDLTNQVVCAKTTSLSPFAVGMPDTTAPVISVTVSPSELTVANHQLVPVTATVRAFDTGDPRPEVRLVSVTSNEPDAGLGDGDLPGDVQGAQLGTDDRTFFVRAERSPAGKSRLYKVTYEAIDRCGNRATASAYVRVPLTASLPPTLR